MSHCQYLIRLAEHWRTKAANVRAKYGAQAPNLVNHCALALETCAEELEDEIHRARMTSEPQTPNPKP